MNIRPLPRDIAEFDIGEILYCDWDKRLVVLKAGGDIEKSRCDRLGILYPLRLLEDRKYTFTDECSFLTLSIGVTNLCSGVIIQDKDTGELLERVVSYNAVTRLCVRIVVVGGKSQLNPASGEPWKHYEYRNLCIESE